MNEENQEFYLKELERIDKQITQTVKESQLLLIARLKGFKQKLEELKHTDSRIYNKIVQDINNAETFLKELESDDFQKELKNYRLKMAGLL